MESFVHTYQYFVRFFMHFTRELETFFYLGCENWINKQQNLPIERQKLLEYLNTHFNPDHSFKEENIIKLEYFKVLNKFFRAEDEESKYNHMLDFEYAKDMSLWTEFKYIIQENSVFYEILKWFSKNDLIFWELCLFSLSAQTGDSEMKVDNLKNIKTPKEFATILEKINDFFVMVPMVDKLMEYRRYHKDRKMV